MATKDYINKIINAHVLKGLKLLDDVSINMCVTSPPYWGLRDYKTEPIVWDGKTDCVHEWGSECIVKGQYGLNKDFNKRYSGYQGGNKKQEDMKFKEINQGSWCQKCGAWCGQLGLEPDFNLYIKHLCDIFDEVKRVLREDGSCWVNISDTYNSHSTGKGNVGGIEKNNKLLQDIQAGNHKKIDLPDKCLIGIPERFMLEMVNPNWVLKNNLTQQDKEYVMNELIKRGVL